MRSFQGLRTAAINLGFLAGLAVVFGLALTADAAAQGRIPWNASGGAAIKGYDPVTYFETGEPTLGDERYAYTWSGVTWHFATGENLAAFIRDPEAYAPQYGGYAALAMTLGGAKDIDPQVFIIEDGKLYLFGSRNRYTTWRRRKERNIKRADDNWERIQEVLVRRTGDFTRRCGEAYSKRQFREAQELCQEPAEKGKPDFQAMLGIAFADAPVQFRNYEQAVSWLAKAAEQGQRDAQWRLAGLYVRGRGVGRNYEAALHWYEEAAKNGHIRARTKLGEMYRDGLGTPVDLVLAYQWFNLGAIASQAALEERDKMGRRLTPAQLLKAQLLSIEWLQQNRNR